MTLNQQAASGQVADDVEIAAMVAGKDGLRVLLQPQVDRLLAASYRPRPWRVGSTPPGHGHAR